MSSQQSVVAQCVALGGGTLTTESSIPATPMFSGKNSRLRPTTSDSVHYRIGDSGGISVVHVQQLMGAAFHPDHPRLRKHPVSDGEMHRGPGWGRVVVWCLSTHPPHEKEFRLSSQQSVVGACVALGGGTLTTEVLSPATPMFSGKNLRLRPTTSDSIHYKWIGNCHRRDIYLIQRGRVCVCE